MSANGDQPPPDISGSSPALILRRCREYHGISLDEAAEVTKIGKNYLRALEEDSITEFASPAYLKGFLRIYATYLGLNPDDLIRLHEKQYDQETQGKGKGGDVSAETGEIHRRRFSWRKLVLPFFILLLILATSVFIDRRDKQSVQRVVQLSPASLPAQSPQPDQAVLPVRSTATRVAPDISKNASIPAEESPRSDPAKVEQNFDGRERPETESFIVRMKVTQNGRLTVIIDGSLSQNYDLTVGDVIVWKAEKSISLDLTNGGGVETELNDRPLKPFGIAGKPAYVVLNADGPRQ